MSIHAYYFSPDDRFDMLLSYRVNRKAIHSLSNRQAFIKTPYPTAIDQKLIELWYKRTGESLSHQDLIDVFVDWELYKATREPS